MSALYEVRAGKGDLRPALGFMQQSAGARDLVERWDRVVARFMAVLPRLDTDPAYGPARKALLAFRGDLSARPGAVVVLRERGNTFGMEERVALARLVADTQPERAVDAMVKAAEMRTRAQMQEQAQQQAAQEEARRQELASKPRPRRGPSMGM